MRVHSPHRRSGIGTRLLELLLTGIETRICYCIPYSHLRGFYQRAGFIHDDTASAPCFLRDRLNEYSGAGNSVILMLRDHSNYGAPERFSLSQMFASAQKRTSPNLVSFAQGSQTVLSPLLSEPGQEPIDVDMHRG